MDDKYKKIFSKLYIALLIITMINMFLPTTNFKYDDFKFILNTVQFVLQLSMVFKVCLEWKSEWTNKDILIGVLTAGVFLAVGCNLSRPDAFAYAFLIMGAKGIDKKKILNVLFYASLAMFVLTVGACLLGFIRNTVTYRSVDSSHARMSLGFIYATSLSAHYLFLVACYVMVRDRKISIIEIALIAISAGATYYLTEARIASFAIAMIAIGLVVAKICYMKNIDFKLVRLAFIKWGMIFASCIMMAFAVIIGVFYEYGNAFWSKVNAIFSQRPLTNAITFNRYPITMLGTESMSHCEVYDGMNELPQYYYIINCSYIDMLFRIGILGAAAVLIIWTLLSYKEVKNNNYMNAFMLAVLTVFFFFEQRFFEFTFNPFLILILSSYSSEIVDEKYDIGLLKKFGNGNKICRIVLTSLAIGFAVELVAFNYQSLSSYLNESTLVASGEMFSDEFAHNSEVDMLEYKNLDPVMIIDNVNTYNDLSSIQISFNLMTKDDNYHYRLVDDCKYSVDYYIYTEEEVYSYLGTVEIESGKPFTGYIPVDVAGPTHSMYYQFHFPDYYYVDIPNWGYNGMKPFEINYIRVLVMTVILSALMTVVVSAQNKKENA